MTELITGSCSLDVHEYECIILTQTDQSYGDIYLHKIYERTRSNHDIYVFITFLMSYLIPIPVHSLARRRYFKQTHMKGNDIDLILHQCINITNFNKHKEWIKINECIEIPDHEQLFDLIRCMLGKVIQQLPKHDPNTKGYIEFINHLITTKSGLLFNDYLCILLIKHLLYLGLTETSL